MRRLVKLILLMALLVVGGCAYLPTAPPLIDRIDNPASDNLLENPEPAMEVADDRKENIGTEGDDLNLTEDKGADLPDKEVIPSNSPEISLLVTRDFGQGLIFNQRIAFGENDSLLNLMEEHLDIATSYGGSFISGINGIKMTSGAKKSDWFFYINGIASHSGLRDYELRARDKIMWDYHYWSAASSNNAIIGQYPAPFLQGYRGTNKPTNIISDEGNVILAEKLALSLQNAGVVVKVNRLSNTSINEEPTIVIGQWSNLATNDFLQGINKRYQKNGLGVHFLEEGLDLLDFNGRLVKSVTSDSAVIVAWGRSLGDDSPIWLIVGTDEKALTKAVELLMGQAESIAGLYGLALLPEGNIPLPLN